MTDIFLREPALIIAGIGAIIEAAFILAIAFGLPVTPDQKLAATAFITVLVTVLTGLVTRSQVTPMAIVMHRPSPPTG